MEAVMDKLFNEPEKNDLRRELKKVLGIPDMTGPPASEKRGAVNGGGFTAEKWIYESEPGNWAPALLYMPINYEGKLPAIVVTNGHGDSKSSLNSRYAGPLYARFGIASLIIDTIGEEERHITGGFGTRAHDANEADGRSANAGRLILGKVVLDHIRGIDFLETLPYIDGKRIGVAGASMGGAAAQFLTALDTRISMSLIAAYGLMRFNEEAGKKCTTEPYKKMAEVCGWREFLSLFVPHSAVLFLDGDADDVMDVDHPAGTHINSVREGAALLAAICGRSGYGAKTGNIEWAGCGHRTYHFTREAMLWVNEWLGTPAVSREEIYAFSELRFETWIEKYDDINAILNDPNMVKYYWTERHTRGATYLYTGAPPLGPDQLRCLKPGELGDPKYTLEGWLDLIEMDGQRKNRR